MNLYFLELVGFLAGLLMSMSFVPQCIKIIKTKETEAISIAMYVSYVIACILWFSYGVMIGSIAMVFWNFVTIVFAGSVLYMKIKYG